MERKIGEIFEYNGDWYQCIEDTERISCINCCFYNGGHRLCTDESMGVCISEYRSDKKSMCFKKLEKVGEPFYIGKKFMQNYKVFIEPYIPKELEYFIIKATQDLIILVEIKQNKEDMKMKKVFMDGDDRDYLLDRLEDILHDNHCLEYKDEICNSLCKYITSNNRELKPFNLEDAKAGKPVCTRDGRKARIICFDRKGKQPIIALVKNGDIEGIYQFDSNGRSIIDDEKRGCDLMMLPEKKKGWVNVYKDGDNNYRSTIYTNEKVALSRKGSDCITTIKISWEE